MASPACFPNLFAVKQTQNIISVHISFCKRVTEDISGQISDLKLSIILRMPQIYSQ